MRRVLLLAFVALFALPAAAYDSPLAKGRMNVGLGANGGRGFFTVGASYGYFVIDRLRPALSVDYTYRSTSGSTSHEVDTNLSLRYYFLDPRPISPFLTVDGGYIHLAYSGTFVDAFDYFSVGFDFGVMVALSKNLGLDLVAGFVDYLGVDRVLFDSGVLPEGLSFRWSFGLNVMF